MLRYFPDQHLARWFQQQGENVPIYCFDRSPRRIRSWSSASSRTQSCATQRFRFKLEYGAGVKEWKNLPM